MVPRGWWLAPAVAFFSLLLLGDAAPAGDEIEQYIPVEARIGTA